MKNVIGIDEVGRGPFAGPVTVCAVYIEDTKQITKDLFENTIRDSKRIKKSLRNKIYTTIRNNRYIKTKIIYAISSRSAKYIDAHGLRLALRSCVRSCLRSLEKQTVPTRSIAIHLDAGLCVAEKGYNQKSFVKGDEKFAEIALASIIAKEYRDSYMISLSKKYPVYAWDRNVGYGTQEHCEAITQHGITKFHRISFLKGFKQFEKTEN